MTPIFGGMDFGTSNSTVAVMRDGRPELVRLEGEQVTLPSAIFFSFEDNRTQFGRRAIAEYTDGVEGRLMRALKSVLGSSLISEKTRIKSRSIAFSDIIGMVIAELKRKLEHHVGGPVERIVMGRPVHFVDGDGKADARAEHELRQAAKTQGFSQVEFQYEPIAAALSYEQDVTREELALIVDMGGGTSDFTVIRVSPERARKSDRRDDILANKGIHIGGTDFDRLLSLRHVMPHLGYLTPTKDEKRNLPAGYFVDFATWQRINLLYTPKAMLDLRQIRYEAARPDLVDRFIALVEHRHGHALAAKVEAAKIALTDADLASVAVDFPDVAFDAKLGRAALEASIAEPVERVAGTVAATLDDAGVKSEDITSVFLTGGSTAVPLARRSILSLVPGAAVVEGDMFGSVGLGLALDAQRRYS